MDDVEKTVSAVVDQTLEQGYGSSLGEWSAEAKFGAFAVPIRNKGRVIACINIVYLLSSLAPSVAVTRFIKPLWDTARSIEDALDQQNLVPDHYVIQP